MNFLSTLVIFFIASAPLWSHANLSIPKNLNSEERKSVLSVLGFGTASKVLTNPWALGGSQGVEVSLRSEFISVDSLAGLGSKTSTTGEYSYLTLSFSKGLFYNVDMEVFFTPLPQKEEVMVYGGQVRWSFWEAQNFPSCATLVFHGSGANFANQLDARTVGTDLIVTVSMKDAAIYFGGGTIRSVGTFLGGTNGIIASGEVADEDISDSHTVFGISMEAFKLNLSFEVDRVVQSSYSGKIGYRF